MDNRSSGRLLPQDEFVRDTVTAKDTLVVSVGGNDIALRPSLGTVWNMLLLVSLGSKSSIEDGTAWGMKFFRRMFRKSVQRYIESVTAKTRPRRVIVCMIYHLDEVAGGSWADRVLSLLGYNKDPSKLQALIRKTYETATCQIKVEGTEVVPFPLFEVLDGKCTEDYVQRVEPSVQGGQKMAEALHEVIVRD